MKRLAVRTQTRLTRQLRAALALAPAGLLLTTSSASAQLGGTTTPTTAGSTTTITSTTTPPTARVIKWDLPAQSDARPGAMQFDGQGRDRNQLWFVTRVGSPTVYRVQFPKSLFKGSARWSSWQLNAALTGGIKKIRTSKDRRFIYIRTITVDPPLGEAVERIDTQKCSNNSCERKVWADPELIGTDVSDVAVDDGNSVFTSHTPNADPTQSYIQKLTPSSDGASAAVTRWLVPGSGAGLCGNDSPSDPTGSLAGNTPCISGIDIHPNYQNLVYYSEPARNSIAELDTTTAKIRRWSLDDLTAAIVAFCSSHPTAARCTDPDSNSPISGPRQLHIDRWGQIWVVTASGHLVSLDPCHSTMTSHQMPQQFSTADPFSLAPDDDVIGYTRSNDNKVGMLIPTGQPFCVSPTSDTATKQCPPSITTSQEGSVCNSGWVCPVGKKVNVLPTTKSDGVYIEAQIDTGIDDSGNADPSMNPMGITPVKAKAQGTFFYAVGTADDMSVDRVEFVRLPVRQKIKHPRDDDDKDDGWSGDTSWHNWHGHSNVDDDDDDGFENEQDSPTAYESVDRRDAAPIAGGQTADYPMTASATTLALIAKAEADNPLAQIGAEIYDANGLLVAKSLPTPGVAVVTVPLPAAGTYTFRVRNYGATPVNHTPTMVVREPVDPQDLIDPPIAPVVIP